MLTATISLGVLLALTIAAQNHPNSHNNANTLCRFLGYVRQLSIAGKQKDGSKRSLKRLAELPDSVTTEDISGIEQLTYICCQTLAKSMRANTRGLGVDEKAKSQKTAGSGFALDRRRSMPAMYAKTDGSVRVGDAVGYGKTDALVKMIRMVGARANDNA